MTKRQRERRRQRRKAVRRYAREVSLLGHDPEEAAGVDPARQLPAKPSAYGVMSLAERMASSPVSSVILYCRESTDQQDLRSKLKGSRRRVRDQGVKLPGTFGETTSGKSLDPADRPELVKALGEARRRGVPLAVPCISRLVRSAAYHPSKNPNGVPTVAEFEKLLELAGGVEIVTLDDPDSTPPQDEAFLRQLTAEASGRKVGRPPNKPAGYAAERREHFLNLAVELHTKGWSLRAIAEKVSRESGYRISHVAIRNWLRKATAGRVRDLAAR